MLPVEPIEVGRVSPERTCVGCREVDEQAELLRLALDRVAGVVLDPARRLGGRGAYLHPRADCIDRAIRRRAIPRALRAPGCDTSAVSALKRRLGESLDKA